MSVAAMVSPCVAKEIRALLPVWALSVVGLGASFVWRDGIPLAAIVYGVGVLALGAQSIGQEYSYRTLPMLLAQPVDRRRLLRIKAGVLVPMLLAVLAIAGFVFVDDDGRRYATTSGLVVLLLPVLCALLLTPWLTMVCRSPLAGVVFSISLPGTMLTLAMIFVPGAGFDVGLGGMLMLFAVTGVLGWQHFMRLEAIDTTAESLHLPSILRTRRPHHPLWMLTLKELHLQQLTFALVAVYLAVWAALTMAQRAVPGATHVPLDVLTPIYLVLLTLLIGALASSEERQYGTLDWQQLLPVAAWHQWMVKVAVVFGLAALFAIALPWLLGLITAGTTDRGSHTERAMVVIVLTAGSLYVSSLCRSGMHAAVLSMAVLPVGLALFIAVIGIVVSSMEFMVDMNWLPRMSRRLIGITTTLMLVASLGGLLVRFAYLNHRYGDRVGEFLPRQLAVILGCLAFWSVAIAALIVML